MANKIVLPTINNVVDLQRALKSWQTKLNPLLNRATTPHAPWNFRASRQRGGILLQWAAIAGADADGYQILRSDNGDFSAAITISITSVLQNSYFDSLGGTAGGTGPIQKWYRIRATNGTDAAPHSVLGILSGVVTTTSIDPTDITTGSSTTYDRSLNDRIQSSANRGRIIGEVISVD